VDDPCKRYYNLVKTASLKAATTLAGSSPLRRIGIGVEVEDFRKFAEGDDARRIDWRITARKPSPSGDYELFVKEYRAERNLKPIVIVDATASMNFWNKALTALYAASFILNILSAFGDKPSLLLLSDKVEVFRNISADALPYLLAKKLCEAEPKGGLTLTECTQYVGLEKPIFVITDYAHSLDELKDFLRFIKASNTPTMFILVSAIEEKTDYGLANITFVDPEKGYFFTSKGSVFQKEVNLHVKTIKNILSLHSIFVEIEGLKSFTAKSNKILLCIVKVREKCY